MGRSNEGTGRSLRQLCEHATDESRTGWDSYLMPCGPTELPTVRYMPVELMFRQKPIMVVEQMITSWMVVD